MAAYEEQDYNKPFSFKTWAKMLPFFKPYTKFFAVTIGLNLILAGIMIPTDLLPQFLRKIIKKRSQKDHRAGSERSWAQRQPAQQSSVWWQVWFFRLRIMWAARQSQKRI